jgi:hypothetical protein
VGWCAALFEGGTLDKGSSGFFVTSPARSIGQFSISQIYGIIIDRIERV